MSDIKKKIPYYVIQSCPQNSHCIFMNVPHNVRALREGEKEREGEGRDEGKHVSKPERKIFLFTMQKAPRTRLASSDWVFVCLNSAPLLPGVRDRPYGVMQGCVLGYFGLSTQTSHISMHMRILFSTTKRLWRRNVTATQGMLSASGLYHLREAWQRALANELMCVEKYEDTLAVPNCVELRGFVAEVAT